jgi:hypothetical protein
MWRILSRCWQGGIRALIADDQFEALRIGTV